jgi:sulfur relay (sulfurtransferase) DsrC/TusE family protein
MYQSGTYLVKVWYTGGMATTRKSKNLRLTPEDWEIIAELKRYYGATSDNEVIRMALRAAQREIGTQPPLPQTKNAFHPHA